MNPPRRLRTSGSSRMSHGHGAMTFALGKHRYRPAARIRAWEESRFLRRLWAKDPTLWASGPTAEISDRLGWLNLPERMAPRLAGLTAFAEDIKAEGFTHIVLLGMGGSSLAPEVFQKTLGSAPGSPALIVLDSTHPAAVAAVERRINVERTLFVVSSKSGTTIEPLSFFRYFWARARQAGGPPGRRFVAVTDAGTPLATLAAERGFRRAFEADPDVGGRYSALTEFGLVPAALIGLDAGRLLANAADEARANGPEVQGGKAPGLLLGAALGEIASSRDKLTILTSPSVGSFPDWLEQLIAESTGKDGKGIVPVAGEPALAARRYGPDRVFLTIVNDSDSGREVVERAVTLEKAGHPLIRIRMADAYVLGREIFRWEVAIAAASSVLGIHPFDQPDVELAKKLAREAMTRSTSGAVGKAPLEEAVPASDPAALRPAFDEWLGSGRPGDYIALQAYLAPDSETTRALQGLRLALLKKTGLATTLGYGPRFLHSTGQLHKGGPDEVLVLQLVDEPDRDLPVPETDFTFGALIKAQALGDYQALRQRGRRVLRVNLKGDPAGGVGQLERLAGSR